MKSGFITNKKRLLISLLSVVIIFILVSAEVFAWFSYSQGSNVNDIDMSVQGQIEASTSIEIVEASTSESIELLPGSTNLVEINLNNYSSATVAMQIYFDSISVKYPFADGFSYSEEYIDTDDYYIKGTNKKFDISTIPSDELQDFMKSFVTPVTNQIEYEWYAVATHSFVGTQTEKYLTDDLTITHNDLTTGNFIVLNDQQIKCSVNSYGVSDGIVNSNGSINVEKGSSKAYLLLYYNPDSISYGEYNSIQIERRNSNAFIGQSFKINIDVKVL